MPKQNFRSPKPQTHFEQVPLEVVVKIADIDTPIELEPAPRPPDQPATLKFPVRAEDSPPKRGR